MTKTSILKEPIVIAHRGAQFIYPEHTIEGYKKAIEIGADYIEPDLVLTKDGVFVARHEPFISGTTNVKDVPEFAHLKTTKILDGVEVTDWFVSDFTLQELKTLRARQSWDNRTHEYDDLFEIPTLEEIIKLVKISRTTKGRSVGIYPELKHPTFHKNIGLPMEEVFLSILTKANLNHKEAAIYVQCFEVASLQYIHSKSNVKLVQLLGAAGINSDGSMRYTKEDGTYDPEGQPYDFVVNKDNRNYGFFTSKEGMKFLATYATGIGPWKPFVIPISNYGDPSREILKPTDFVSLAHSYNLEVHPYTFRNEDNKWNTNEESSSEYQLFLEAGVDGVFSDYTTEAVKARNVFLKKNM